MAPEVRDSKRALRAELREQRRTMPSRLRIVASEGITHFLQRATQRYSARSVACYLSGPNEPSTRDYIDWCLEQQIRVIVPSAREDGLLDWIEYTGQDEALTQLGVPEVDGEALGPIAASYVDLIVTPALAITPNGYRLGQGRGYYDKTFGSMEQAPPTIAVVYDSEVIEDLPLDHWDQPVDAYVTPTRFALA